MKSPLFSTTQQMASRVGLVCVSYVVAMLCECESVITTSADICEENIGEQFLTSTFRNETTWQPATARMKSLSA